MSDPDGHGERAVAGDGSGEHRERELKFDLPDGWQLPDIADVTPAGGSVVRETLRLESTYHDTVDRLLLRSRMTLRRRSGDADTGWHLKVPSGDARLEIREPLGESTTVPEALADLTLGIRRGEPLVPVALLRTERAVHRLLDADGHPLVEIVVDEVHASAFGDRAIISQWREAEAELVDGTEKQLKRVARWLVRSGATPAASASKLARALGESPVEPPARSGLAALVTDYLDTQYAAILHGDIELRRQHDVVHETRVATRRYRSALRVLAKIFDAERAAALDVELAWYAAVLGELRDRHVLRDHLDDALAELPPELVLGPVAARIHEMLDADLAEAQRRLDDVQRGERYYALLAELQSWHERPPVHTHLPASEAARFLRKAQRSLQKRLRTAHQADAPDTLLHRARKAAKRMRYIAELTEPELGAKAEKARTRAKDVQTRLGLRQDRVVAAEFLLRAGAVAGTTPGENGFTFGLLYERERQRAGATTG